MTEDLKISLCDISEFDPKELEEIVNLFKPRSVKKNTILLHEGNVCKEFYYVVRGSIRTYFIDMNGHEKTRYIFFDKQLGTTLSSFISQNPSIEFIEALEDTELLAISHRDFYQLNNKMKSWKIFYQKILERAYMFQNKKIEALVTLTVQQRYEQLLRDNPDFLQRFSNKVLASYLDMREETLSRLKST